MAEETVTSGGNMGQVLVLRSVAACLLFVLSSAHAQEVPEDQIHRYVHRTYSWQRLSLLAVDTGVDHALGGRHSWGPGASAYAYHYSVALGGRVVRNSIELGLGLALDEDTHFQPSHTSGLGARLRYAVTHAFLASGPNGIRPAYSRFAATAGGVLITSQWCPHHSPYTSRVLAGFGFGMLDQVENSLLTEFSPDMKHFGQRLSHKLLPVIKPRAVGSPPAARQSSAN